jgi:hypothetical protein
MAHGRLHALLEIARTRTQSAASASAINHAQDASMRERALELQSGAQGTRRPQVTKAEDHLHSGRRV